MVALVRGRRGGDTPRRPGQTSAEFYPHDDLAIKSIPWIRGVGGRIVDEIDGIGADSSGKVSQVRRRFNRIAPDFDRAVVAAMFTPIQGLLIQQARELAWTRASLDKSPDPYPFRINLSALSRDLGIVRQWLSREHVALVKVRVFIAQNDGLFQLNKDYRQWLDGNGRARLSPEVIRWCLQSLDLWKASSRRSGAGGAAPALQGGAAPALHEAPALQGGAAPALQGVQRQRFRGCSASASPPPDSATIGPGAHAPAELNSIQTNSDNKTPDGEFARVSQEAQIVLAPSFPGECPPYPTPETSVLYPTPGAHPENPTWGAAFWRRLWLALGRPAVRANGTPHPVMGRWYEHQCWYPPERWEAALREMVRAGVVPRGAGYLESIAARPDLDLTPEQPPTPGVLATIPARPARVNATTQHVANIAGEFRARAAARRAEAAKAQEEANASGQ